MKTTPIISAILYLLLSTGCGTLQVPDTNFCADELPGLGYCHAYVSDRSYHLDNDKQLYQSVDPKLNGLTWDKLRPLCLLIPPDQASNLIKFSRDYCAKHKNCPQNFESYILGLEEMVQKRYKILEKM